MSVTRVARHHTETWYPGLQLMQLIIILSLSQVPHTGMLPMVFTPKQLVTNVRSSESSLMGTAGKPGTCCPAV